MCDRPPGGRCSIVHVADHRNDWPLRRLMRLCGRKPVWRLVTDRNPYGSYYLVPDTVLRELEGIRGVTHKPYLSVSDFASAELVPADIAVRHRKPVVEIYENLNIKS